MIPIPSIPIPLQKNGALSYTSVLQIAAGKYTISMLNSSSSVILPIMVPCTTVPFFSSTVTVSWDSFIKNLDTKRENGKNNPEAGISTITHVACIWLTSPTSFYKRFKKIMARPNFVVRAKDTCSTIVGISRRYLLVHSILCHSRPRPKYA